MRRTYIGALCSVAAAASCLALLACEGDRSRKAEPVSLLDDSDGDDWPAYGRTYGEQHFSPLAQINRETVDKLGLAWSFDLPAGNPTSGPIQVGGVLYTSTGYSVVRAYDVATGKLLWTFDPHAPERAGHKLRVGWGSRGLAWWNGKVYVGTQDGRLIAIDARSGKEIWSQQTVDRNDGRFISGAPRAFDGKVIIGHGGADSSNVRGYVTTYDAETGKQLWRFYTVPGNPADGFEDEAQEMAAKTWSGEWWKFGGGGTAWNTFTYDAENDTIFIGTGNGAPWNHRVRSEGKGDNLFLCSVVALDAKTGKYKWHYQFNPAETWDYNAAMDMQLAEILVDGKPRKVLMELPKNGFFYVIDRITGKLISADRVGEVTWAKSIDLASGRPVENPQARLPDGGPFQLFPGGSGAHTWVPSAYSPQSKLIYLPVANVGMVVDRHGIDSSWERRSGNVVDGALNLSFDVKTQAGQRAASSLVAWNPVSRRVAWAAPTPGGWNGGILATGGHLVFQGDAAGRFVAYDAFSGKKLWQFDAHAPVLAPPIAYRHKGRQYVTVLAGIGTSLGVFSHALPKLYNYYSQPRRILTFAIGGRAKLPAAADTPLTAVADPGSRENKVSASHGAMIYGVHCLACHGPDAVAGGTAPDLRASALPIEGEAFGQIVKRGALVAAGMPRWSELSEGEMTDLRQYLRSRAEELRKPAAPPLR